MCRERVEELEPSIRYCQYNLNKSGGKTSVSDLKDLKSQSPAQDLLQVTIDARLVNGPTRPSSKAVQDICAVDVAFHSMFLYSRPYHASTHGPVLTSATSPSISQSKLEAVMVEERKRQAETMSAITWQGRSLPMRNNATRLCILNANDLLPQLSQVEGSPTLTPLLPPHRIMTSCALRTAHILSSTRFRLSSDLRCWRRSLALS